MMVTLFLGNFEFEHRLAWQNDRALAEPVRRLTEELASAWLAVARDGDLLWMPAPVESEFFEKSAELGLPSVQPVSKVSEVPGGTELCPWGFTTAIRDWAESNGWRCHVPNEDAVRQANSRVFSAQLETEWDIGLRGAAVIHSLDNLQQALRYLPTEIESWVLKAEFGMSGREKILGRGTEPSDAARHWLDKRLLQGVVVFEPWVERVEEVGLQFTLPESGPPIFEGVTPMLVDASGTYRGSRITCDAETEASWSSAIETGQRAAEHIQSLGYLGPLGIDAMRYRDHHGQLRIRPLQDINARHTMGRLSLGLRRWLQPGEAATWLHLNRKSVAGSAEPEVDWDDWLTKKLPAGARFIRTSPLRVGQRAVEHMTFALVGQSEAALSEIERSLFCS